MSDYTPTNAPAQVAELMLVGMTGKSKLPLVKMFLLGILAGAFIAFGAEASSLAAHVKFGAAAVLFCAQCALFAMCALGRAKGARLARLEVALGLLALAVIAPVEIFNLSR